MLKPVEPLPSDDRPISELVGQLIDDGKNYALAEFELARAQTIAKAERFKLPAMLIGVAALLAQAAVVVLCVAGFLALLPLMGPLLAGIFTSALVLGLAGLLVWLALRKIKEAA